MKLPVYKLIMRVRAFFLAVCFICCSGPDNAENKVYSNLNEPFVDTLRSKMTGSMITKMELKISGEIAGKGKLFYSHSPFHLKTEVHLEGNIDKQIVEEWYSEKCLIIYQPDSLLGANGELSLRFRTLE